MLLIQLFNSNGIFYIILAFFSVIASLTIIPKNYYKKFFLYGLVSGGIADVVIASLLTLLGLIRYTNFEPFGILGVFSLFTPITWTFAFMLFFYFLPVRKVFLVFYLVAWAGLNWSLGVVMEKLDLFHYYGIQNYISPLMFLIWYSISAYVFRKYEQRVTA